MSTQAPDGTLADWAAIEHEHPSEVLLLGNGLSINVWPNFGYAQLFDYARGGGLRQGDLRLFNGNPNFESVLGDLATAIRVLEAIRQDSAELYRRYRRVQQALGHAVRQVHLYRIQVPDLTLQTIRSEMEKYEWIFTTSYDLIVYWAMGFGERYRPFVDLFRWGNRHAFDPDRADVERDQIPVYFLHGALHLIVSGDGTTWKLTRNAMQTLLDQFGQPIAGDPQARPLLVTEGLAREKVRAIEGNDYLAHCLWQLTDLDTPVVVFGSSLCHQDRHLVDALNANPGRPVAISMRQAGRRKLREKQGDLWGRLESDPLVFFDAATHPLGNPALRAT
jgi:Domain of unknown function (DUF4917)